MSIEAVRFGISNHWVRCVAAGIDITFRILSQTPNEAAADVLAAGLDHAQRAIVDGALRASLARGGKASRFEVLRRWPKLNHEQHEIVRQRQGALSVVIHEAIASGQSPLCEVACDAAVACDDFDQFPLLVHLLKDPHYPAGDRIAQTLLLLADRLYRRATGPRDYSDRRDLPRIRIHAAETIAGGLSGYLRHGRGEVIEAFLNLAARDENTLRRILREPRDPLHAPLLDFLLHSPRTGVIHLLISFLDDPFAPPTALAVIARRHDRPFLRELTSRLVAPAPHIVSENLRRIESIAWLEREFNVIDDLDETGQAGAVRMAAASSMDRGELLDLLEHVLDYGNVGGRRAASQVLPDIEGAKATELLRRALDDPDAQVQANVLSHLRPRNVAGALTTLIAMIDSQHDAVRAAAREGLEEFNVERYLRNFDSLDDDIRRTTGVLVRKVDPGAIPALRHELEAMSRTRRLKALAAAAAMEATRDVEEPVIALLVDPDHMVRASAAHALGGCPTVAARDALREALLDRSVIVQEAAEASLFRLANMRREEYAREAARESVGEPTTDMAALTAAMERLRAGVAPTSEADDGVAELESQPMLETPGSSDEVRGAMSFARVVDGRTYVINRVADSAGAKTTLATATAPTGSAEVQ